MEHMLFSIFMIASASAYTAEFTLSQICSTATTGSEMNVHQHVTSTILCGSLCARGQGCVSFLHIIEDDTCFLNNNFLDDIGQCGTDITYGVKVLTSICTEPVNNMRLCNGTKESEYSSNMGRIEIFYGGQWWGVCDDNWEAHASGEVNANVVCTAFGFIGGVPEIGSVFGHGTASFLLDDVVCNGTETLLLDCAHLDIGEHNCGATEFAGVMCF